MWTPKREMLSTASNCPNEKELSSLFGQGGTSDCDVGVFASWLECGSSRALTSATIFLLFKTKTELCEERQENRVAIENLNNIYNYAEDLRRVFAFYEGESK